MDWHDLIRIARRVTVFDLLDGAMFSLLALAMLVVVLSL